MLLIGSPSAPLTTTTGVRRPAATARILRPAGKRAPASSLQPGGLGQVDQLGIGSAARPQREAAATLEMLAERDRAPVAANGGEDAWQLRGGRPVGGEGGGACELMPRGPARRRSIAADGAGDAAGRRVDVQREANVDVPPA